MQFDGEKPDKITRAACACNDDKVIFREPSELDNPELHFREAGEYEHRVNLGVGWPEPKKQLRELGERGFGQGKGNLFFRMGLGSVAQVGRHRRVTA